jgi:hypothetical protein
MTQSFLFAASMALALTAMPSSGAVIYNETINGDLSGAFASPTPLVLAVGGNTIIARIGNNGNTGATNGSDADYFTVTLGTGESLVSMTLDSYTFSPSNPGVSFAGYIPAAAFAGQAGGNIAGSSLFNASSGNLLVDFTGSSTPLGAGAYSFWFQETSANIVSYQLTLNVVPEPSSALLGACGVLLFIARRRRR